MTRADSRSWPGTAPNPVRIVIAGGGTGGHLFPGLAVARAILERSPAARITFAGTRRGLEARVVPAEGFEIDLIRSIGLKGKAWRDVARGLTTLPASGWDAWRLLSRRRPHVVIGLGGYSSGPIVLVAAVRRVPTMVLEQNAVPGLANRLLARLVQAAALTYPETLPHFPTIGFVSGNPVRPEFLQDGLREPRPAGTPPRVLVFGGSQGAHAINVAVVDAVRFAGQAVAPMDLTHQTGESDFEFVRSAYRELGVAARVQPFFDEMGTEMRRADLVVCRAGATTLAELAASGCPAILVPLPSATNDHQRRNAAALESAGAAMVIEQRDLAGARLWTQISELSRDRERLQRMGLAMRRLARPDAAAIIADRALALAADRDRQCADSGGPTSRVD